MKCFGLSLTCESEDVLLYSVIALKKILTSKLKKKAVL